MLPLTLALILTSVRVRPFSLDVKSYASACACAYPCACAVACVCAYAYQNPGQLELYRVYFRCGGNVP